MDRVARPTVDQQATPLRIERHRQGGAHSDPKTKARVGSTRLGAPGHYETHSAWEEPPRWTHMGSHLVLGEKRLVPVVKPASNPRSGYPRRGGTKPWTDARYRPATGRCVGWGIVWRVETQQWLAPRRRLQLVGDGGHARSARS